MALLCVRSVFPQTHGRCSPLISALPSAEPTNSYRRTDGPLANRRSLGEGARRQRSRSCQAVRILEANVRPCHALPGGGGKLHRMGKILSRDPPANDARFTVLGLLFDSCSGRDWRTCLGRRSAICDFQGLGSRIGRHRRPVARAKRSWLVDDGETRALHSVPGLSTTPNGAYI
jgi:hypothetical protein